MKWVTIITEEDIWVISEVTCYAFTVPVVKFDEESEAYEALRALIATHPDKIYTIKREHTESTKRYRMKK